MARVLITGAAGFVGSHLAEACVEQGHNVVGIDSLTPYYDPAVKKRNLSTLEARGSWSFVEGDIRELPLRDLLADIDVVYHLAAQPGVRQSWGETFEHYVDSNVVAMQRLLEACKSVSLERFVFASSSSVYGNAMTMPTAETATLSPVSPYGATKALGEHLCRIYHESYSLPVVALRYFTVYGPRQRPDMAFHKLIDAALDQREITIYGDGQQTRDFTYVDDAVAATMAAGGSGVPGRVYNVGGGSRLALNSILEMIGELTGAALDIRHVSAQKGDARDTGADTRLVREDLGFSPASSVREGLSSQIAWQRAERLDRYAAVT